MPWKAKPVSILQRENDNLKTTICLLRRELENRQGAVGRLELLVHERTARIDELTGKLEQARAQNQRLDAECEHLTEMMVEMIRVAPITSGDPF